MKKFSAAQNCNEAIGNATLHSAQSANAQCGSRQAHVYTLAPDPDDDIFLECAQEADASYLVTGNTGDFPAKWGETQIVTPRRFLDAMS